ncbi:EexN family lipoprotein [Escherichia coli]|uniref:EexN family lipoprotein n=1 Tax=Escherichia coli TaxID=562 RepID=UPI001C496530|nr:EexN family lipoprotein [Escherichia coli]MBV7681861.1 EexN family lipoprotein [Escherichia coli]UNS24370.1 ExxN protein [Escherichia coli]
MKNYGIVAALGLTFFLAGCQEVKSVDWWQSHPDEATKNVAECKNSGSDSDNCKNANDGLFRYKQLHPKHVDYKDAFQNQLGKEGT